MKACLTPVILAATSEMLMASPALASSPDRQVTKTVKPVQETLKVRKAGFSSPEQVSSFSEMTGLPAVHYIEEALAREGDYFDWYNQDGARFEFRRENGDIIVEAKDRPTSRIRVTEMPENAESKLGMAALALRD